MIKKLLFSSYLLITPSYCYAGGILSNLFNTCDQYCQNRKVNEQQRQQFLDEQAEKKSQKEERVKEFEKTPLGQAYAKSLESIKTIEEGKEYERQEVYILGGVKCESNNLCWIVPQWDDPQMMVDYSRRVMWFDPSHLNEKSLNNLMMCPDVLSCYSIIKGNIQKKYVNIDGKRIRMEGIISENISYINVLPILNSILNN